LCETVAS